jgi:integrase
MACLLLLNGLRVSEVCGIDIDDLAEERWHHTVTIHGTATRTPPSRSPHGPVPRSRRLSTAATAGRCCATGGATA